MGHKYLHVFTHAERFIHIPFPHIFLSPISQSCSFQVSGHSSKPLDKAPELVYNCTSGHFYFQGRKKKKKKEQLLSFGDIPEGASTAAVLHFQKVPLYCPETSLNRVPVSPFSVN